MKITRNNYVHGRQKTYNKKLITSVAEYLAYVDSISRRWEGVGLWFRGVSKARYLLIPAIYRTNDWNFNWPAVRGITDEFIRRAASPSSNATRGLTRWEWYHVMQHHGLPTRLLDWSTGSLIGLYFALRNLPSLSRAAVWILDPFWLNSETIDKYSVIYTGPIIQSTTDLDITSTYLDFNIEDDPSCPVLPKLPLAVFPPNATSRIDTQMGCFTVHGEMTDGLGNVYRRSKSPRLVQLRISDSAAENMKYELNSAGISEATMFPDLDGLARDLRIEFGFREAFRKYSS